MSDTYSTCITEEGCDELLGPYMLVRKRAPDGEWHYQKEYTEHYIRQCKNKSELNVLLANIQQKLESRVEESIARGST